MVIPISQFVWIGVVASLIMRWDFIQRSINLWCVRPIKQEQWLFGVGWGSWEKKYATWGTITGNNNREQISILFVFLHQANALSCEVNCPTLMK